MRSFSAKCLVFTNTSSSPLPQVLDYFHGFPWDVFDQVRLDPDQIGWNKVELVSFKLLGFFVVGCEWGSMSIGRVNSWECRSCCICPSGRECLNQRFEEAIYSALARLLGLDLVWFRPKVIKIALFDRQSRGRTSISPRSRTELNKRKWALSDNLGLLGVTDLMWTVITSEGVNIMWYWRAWLWALHALSDCNSSNFKLGAISQIAYSPPALFHHSM